MNNFIQAYITIGVILYLMTVTFMYMIGKDYINDAINKGEIKDVDINSPILHLILMFLLIVI